MPLFTGQRQAGCHGKLDLALFDLGQGSCGQQVVCVYLSDVAFVQSQQRLGRSRPGNELHLQAAVGVDLNYCPKSPT